MDVMHSIIISHRNRHANLQVCVWSLQRSARLCGVDEYEIVIVDNGSTPPPTAAALTTGGSTSSPDDPRGCDASHIRIVHDRRDMPIFSRAQLMNAGIDAAGTVGRTGEARRPRGDDVLTALDADAIMGRYWIRAADLLADGALTKVTYRLRHLRAQTTRILQSHWPPPAALIDEFFQRYEMFQRSPETLGSGELGVYETGNRGSIYGTSHFSIRRDVLDDLRYDERYVGWGSEDLDLNRRLVRRAGDNYNAYLETRPHWAALLLWHPYGPDWYSPERQRANYDMFRASAAADGDTAVFDRMG
jgi:hypothetical protein